MAEWWMEGALERLTDPADPIARIKDEGMNRSQVMRTLSTLTDNFGPRLTGSPNLRRAQDWLGGWQRGPGAEAA